ncbi:fibroblast growth factor 19 [Pelobates cultripes]|uniref:Fibroblast growth factor n=1 Tax=Pelobates cultripes TaxID=61616 RepID=A0AAD1WX61_PELCU|nr:fibroblast growth factor 19 [Pelobates cultripes]
MVSLTGNECMQQIRSHGVLSEDCGLVALWALSNSKCKGALSPRITRNRPVSTSSAFSSQILHLRPLLSRSSRCPLMASNTSTCRATLDEATLVEGSHPWGRSEDKAGIPSLSREALGDGVGPSQRGNETAKGLLEIRAVAVGVVAIKGYYNTLYLCMGTDGKLYGMPIFSTEDCSFEEELLPDGYNMYKSSKYGIAVSLSKDKQRQQYKGKGYLPLSHFLPVISWVPMEVSNPLGDEDYRFQYNMDENKGSLVDSMDPLGLVQYPNYHNK